MSLGLRGKEGRELGSWEVRDGVIAIYRPLNIDSSDPDFFEELEEAIKSYFTRVVIDRHNYCGEDEAIHFWVGNILFHACCIAPEEVSIVPEVKCPFCGKWVTIDLFVVHLAIEHGGQDEEEEEI
jgi:hypothetical protein